MYFIFFSSILNISKMQYFLYKYMYKCHKCTYNTTNLMFKKSLNS